MFIVYSKPGCPACDKAKELLASRKLPYEEKVLDIGQPKLEGVDYFTVEQLKRLLPGVRTVPVIFGPASQMIGGYDALQKFLGQI
jgi:glutaredoxin